MKNARVILILLVVFDDAKDKHPSRFVRILLLSLTGLSGIIVADLVIQPPSNYQFVSLQTLVLSVFVFVVVGLGLFSIYENREKSRKVFVANDKGKKQSKKNTSKEPKKNTSGEPKKSINADETPQKTTKKKS